MIWIVVPAVAYVPEPWFVPQTEESVHQDPSVEHPPKTQIDETSVSDP